ncbi:MAG: aldo/keto reductase [Bacillota bacterium]|nr:aldo/keto reductase [Bacillota bacterium]
MRYRSFGKVGWQPSALGFGCMRLPIKNEDTKQIDEPEATRMVRYAIDHGVNYVDTAYGYHGGQSEVFLGRALAGGYRERVRVATKLPMWLLKEPGDMDRCFAEQRERLQIDHIDLYLLHGLDGPRWELARKLGVPEWAERQKKAGHLGHLGFSFHARLETFKDIVTGYDGWEFCQIQYNYMDTEYQAGTEGLQFAAQRGLGVVVMEPLRGGLLAAPPPAAVAEVFERSPARRTPADRALQWLWNQPEVSVVLSGMSAMQHVTENVDSAGRSGVGSLSAAEIAVVDAARAAYNSLARVDCTGCEYCLPCPQGINIPRHLGALNEAAMYGVLARYRRMYSRIPEDQRPGACQACAECEAKCPQGLPIRDLLAEAHRTFGDEAKPGAE